MMRGRRGASEVLGAIVIAVLVLGMSVSYVLLEMGRAGRETLSMIELLRRAERRQKQLLSLVFYRASGGSLYVYLYNFGEAEAALTRILTDREVPPSEATLRNADTGEVIDVIPPRILVELVIPAPSMDEFTLVLVTDAGGVFSWKLVI